MKRLCLLIVLATVVWSLVRPHDMFTWWLEATPALLGLIIVLATARRFPLTPLLCILLSLHAMLLLIGAHYTYAEVPPFNWLRDTFDLTRNHYDRLGHFMQGFVPALTARELLLRTSPLKPGKWLFAIITLGCLGISAAYELIEWAVSVNTGDRSTAFLGTQGDVWDTQKDMLMALIGAITSQLLLSRSHDHALKNLR